MHDCAFCTMRVFAITVALALVASVRPSGATFWGEGACTLCLALFIFIIIFIFILFSNVCFPGSDSDVSVRCSADSRQMQQSLLSGQVCSSDNGCPPKLLCKGGKCSACSSDAQCAAHNPHKGRPDLVTSQVAADCEAFVSFQSVKAEVHRSTTAAAVGSQVTQ